jgi:hypothetical protein
MLTRWGLFLGSYAPLLVILFVRFTEPWLQILCALGAIAGAALTIWVLRSNRPAGNATASIEVTRVEDSGDQATAYLVTYLLPFAAVARPDPREAVAYLIYFLVLGIVYTGSDMQMLNPTLYLLRHRVSRVTTNGGRTLLAISRRRLLPGPISGTEPTSGILLVDEVDLA